MKLSEFDEAIMKTLSFFEPMTKEAILNQIPIENLNQEYTLADLERALRSLERRKIIHSQGKGRDKAWIKKTPRKRGSLYNKTKRWLKSLF